MKYTLLALALTPIIAMGLDYQIYIDAGSTGSRLYLFQTEQTGSGSVPVIKQVFSESVKPGISSFVSEPQQAGSSLQPLLDDAAKQLQQLGVNKPIPVNVLATAGMRLLPVDQQTPIYHSIKSTIQQSSSSLSLGKAETITGQMEGLYAWLDVNYLANTFQKQQPTLGLIDMGGASTQIAFETADRNNSTAKMKVAVGGHVYRVFSTSFLGLGQDQARGSMGNQFLASACYVPSYPMNGAMLGAYDLATCQDNYRQVIEPYKVEQQLVPISAQQKFLVFSGAYYDFHFFDADTTPEERVYENHIQTTCQQSWSELQKNHPNESTAYLASYCANGTYVDQLLYKSYHLHARQLMVADQVNGHNIAWPLGALLYALSQ